MLKFNKYIADATVDLDQGVLHGEVLNTRDIITFEGRTVTELEIAFRASIDDYLAFCKERGEEPACY